MPKNYKRKRGGYKKKSYRRSSKPYFTADARTKASKYDGTNFVKIVDVTGIVHNSTLGRASIVAQWGANDGMGELS